MEMIVITVEEFKKILNDTFKNTLPIEGGSPTPQPFIKGIHQLATFLSVSAPRAQKLKNEKVISCFQDGRLVLFDPETVRKEMAAYNQSKKRK